MPKTGGTSVLSYLRKNKSNLLNSKPYSNRHVPYSLKQEESLSKSGNVKKLTTLRDPVSHTKSLYSHMNNVSLKDVVDPFFRKRCEEAQSMQFSKWIRHYDLEDFYLKFYDPNCKPEWEGGKNPSLDNAVSSLKDFTVMYTESLNDDFNSFLSSIGEKPNFDIHINVSKDVTITDEDVEYIKEVRKNDYILIDSTRS